VYVSPHRGVVRLPPGTRLDLGGIGKGRAADLVATHLSRRLTDLGATDHGVLVNLGGDVRCVGAPAPGEPWRVDISDPRDRRASLATLALPHGGVATSTTARRAWTTPDGPAHHLIDPRTGASADAGVVAATVVAADASWAEVLAKAILVGGIDEGFDHVERLGLAAAALTDDGRLVATERLPLHLVAPTDASRHLEEVGA
jgi:thiamine biosynthesis lipoprotein